MSERRTCDCCRILDGDETLKECTFCGLCKAWLCATCKLSPSRRYKAALESPRVNDVLGPKAVQFLQSLVGKNK